MSDSSASSLALPDAAFWKRKLAAFLHDPPSKCLDIATHGERSHLAFARAGFTDQEIGLYDKPADHAAAAADRLPFPGSSASGLRCQFDGLRNGFHHPLGGSVLHFEPFPSAAFGEEIEQVTQPSGELQFPPAWTEAQVWRARHFAHWRLWPVKAAEKNPHFVFLPADTRIPDHTIWNHMQVVSALAGCGEGESLRPAFLKIQLGGVQDFIGQARLTRDLWSGSYLMSWLMATGLKRLSELCGPDAVVYPSLRGQPLFDLLWRDELWESLAVQGQPVWGGMIAPSPQDLTTPNLVNVALAVVPAARAAAIARAVAQAMRQEWLRIAESVWAHADQAGVWARDLAVLGEADRRQRWETQIGRFPGPSWQVLPWPDHLEEALRLAENLPQPAEPEKTPGSGDHRRATTSVQRLARLRQMAEKEMDPAHRDRRYYVSDNRDQLAQTSLAWSALADLCGWMLDASRQTQTFPGTVAGVPGTAQNKDALNGRDEAVAGGHGWAKWAEGRGDPWRKLFRHDDWIGAVNFLKRLWPYAYLAREPWCLTPPRMPNTQEMAAHQIDADDATSGNAGAGGDFGDSAAPGRYFAILALDGDSMGEWVSGTRNPCFGEQLADYSEAGERRGAKSYFEQARFGKDFLATQRPVSPGFHLQFSESLANFALRCARPIVEAHEGKLIYAGGDDVLAMLPADRALACAEDLQAAFRGIEPVHKSVVMPRLNPDGSPARGFMVRDQERGREARAPVFVVPGPRAGASVGIAIAHFRSPLQDVVRAAQQAERRAKQVSGKGALAVSVLKRSGEITEWATPFAARTHPGDQPGRSGGLRFLDRLVTAIDGGFLSAKFPHRLIELLEPYLLVGGQTADPDFPAQGVLTTEFEFALGRQRGPAWPERPADLETGLRESFQACLGERLSGSDPAQSAQSDQSVIRGLIGLCTVAAFLRRLP